MPRLTDDSTAGSLEALCEARPPPCPSHWPTLCQGSGKVGQMLRVKEAPVGECEWCFGSEGETIKRREHGGPGFSAYHTWPALEHVLPYRRGNTGGPSFLSTEVGSRQTCPSQRQRDSLSAQDLWGNETITAFYLLHFWEILCRNYSWWCHKGPWYPDQASGNIPVPMLTSSCWLCMQMAGASSLLGRPTENCHKPAFYCMASREH